MGNDDRPGRMGQTAQDVKEYAGLYIDRFKLGLIDNLATFFNTLYGVLVLVVLFGIAAMFFAVALTWVLSILMGSVLYATLAMGGLFVVFGLIVLALRKKLVINPLVRIFSRMMYDVNKSYSDHE